MFVWLSEILVIESAEMLQKGSPLFFFVSGDIIEFNKEIPLNKESFIDSISSLGVELQFGESKRLMLVCMC